MTLSGFELLPLRKQINFLYREGVYVGKRKDENITAVLFQVDSFYVEIFYRKYRCIISRLHCFTSTALLDPYLTQVDVEYLHVV